MIFKPCVTNARLTPQSGTMSQTVPSADQVEPLPQIRLGRLGIPSGLAQQPVDINGEQEGDADGGEVVEARRVVEPLRIDDGASPAAGTSRSQMMVDDDDIEARTPRRSPTARARRCRNRR